MTYLNWTNTDAENEYFVKESSDKWIEYRCKTKYMMFNEIKRYDDKNGLVVVLEKISDLFLKLTDSDCFFGSNENDVSNCLYRGNWTKSSHEKTPKIESNNIVKLLKLFSNNLQNFNTLIKRNQTKPFKEIFVHLFQNAIFRYRS